MGAIIPERIAGEIDGGRVAPQAGPAIDSMAVRANTAGMAIRQYTDSFTPPIHDRADSRMHPGGIT